MTNPVPAAPADPRPILDLIEAFRRSKTMFAAAALGVFDRLALGPATAAEVAEAGAHAETMERLLDACVSLDLLEKQDGRYANSAAAAAYLVKSSPHAFTGYVLYSNQVLYQMWSHLEDAVREGTHRWNQTFGFSGPIFDHFFRTPESMRTFIMGMHGFGVLSSPAVVRAFDLSQYKKIVDLGGASGHLTIAACEAYPQMEGIVFDLPGVLPVAREQIANSQARDRIGFVAGDFFVDDLPHGDLYALGRILHDWTEEKIMRLLKRIREKLPNGGALLIAEKLLNDDGLGPVAAHMQSLNMLICTEGKERSAAEYERLLRESGFATVRSARTDRPVDVVLAETK